MANSFCMTLESRNGCDAPWQTLLLQVATPMCLCAAIASTAVSALTVAVDNSNNVLSKAFIAILPSLAKPSADPRSKRLDRCICLLYTSDAADERSSVDLGGR